MLTTAVVELFVCWFAWGYPFILQAPHRQKRLSVTDPVSTCMGLILQGAAIFIAWAIRFDRQGSPGTARILASMALGPVAAALAWSAVKHLGRQFRISAGIFVDHELVRTGPYRVVRHPIYASLLLLLLSTLLLLTAWPWFGISLALYIAGAEVRIRAEDRFLASRFGQDFAKYRKDVRAYIPFLR
ncbi:MAG: isoprenylcysteine carboxylmethyltransferase family protein [Bryobacteraceae bacterium]|jgi:protein-S-isoprenylcysteine O-methyltransferase Ste14